MKLDLSCTSNAATVLSDCPSDRVRGKPVVADVDLGDLRPSHPVLIVDRAECDLDADSSLTIAPEILHIKVVDRDRGVAHFHVRVGVRYGRPFVSICASGLEPSRDNKKRSTGVWFPPKAE